MLDPRHNPEAKAVWVGIGLVVAGLLLMTVPSLMGVDGMDGGFALAAFGLLLGITGLVTTALVLPRARRMNAMLSGRGLLAHWVYTPSDTQEQAQRIQQQWSERNRGLFAIVAAWMVVITTGFVVFGLLSGDSEFLPLFLAIMAGVMLVVAVFAFGMPYLLARRAVSSRQEAYIGRDSLYFAGTMYRWDSKLETLDGVELERDDKGTRLAFHLRSRSAPYLQYLPYLVEVPIPPGEEAAAADVARQLQG